MLRVAVPLIVAFMGCSPSTPTSPQQDASNKQVAQEFLCEAVILDTVISAIVYSESGSLITLKPIFAPRFPAWMKCFV